MRKRNHEMGTGVVQSRRTLGSIGTCFDRRLDDLAL